MPSILSQSTERLAALLIKPVIEAGDAIALDNFLQFPRDTLAYARFVVGSHILSGLLCDNIFSDAVGEPGRDKVFETTQRLKDMHVSHLTRKWNPTIAITDVVIWEVEANWYRRLPGNPAINVADLKSVTLPLADILHHLYVVRGIRFISDFLEGANDQLERPHSIGRLIMPACRTLILQTTNKAADEDNVLRFTISVVTKWLLLQARVAQALQG